MAAIDDLNAVTASIGSDVTALQSLGQGVYASVETLMAQAAAGAPDLKPAIAALAAAHLALQSAITQGTAFAATLPPGTPPAEPATSVAPVAAPATGLPTAAAPGTTPGS